MTLTPSVSQAADLEILVNLVKKKAIALFSPERMGGYFCLADRLSGRPITMIGTRGLPMEKMRQYMTFACEKAERLGRHPSHATSWQSRDEARERYAGAVRGKDLIFSYSGFPELVDEAMMLVVAIHRGQLSLSSARDYAKMSGNEYFAPLFEATASIQP